jgi:hypothetical protein
MDTEGTVDLGDVAIKELGRGFDAGQGFVLVERGIGVDAVACLLGRLNAGIPEPIESPGGR